MRYLKFTLSIILSTYIFTTSCTTKMDPITDAIGAYQNRDCHKTTKYAAKALAQGRADGIPESLLARCARDKGQFLQAVHWFDKAIGKNGANHPEWYRQRANTYFELAQTVSDDRQLRYLTKAIQGKTAYLATALKQRAALNRVKAIRAERNQLFDQAREALENALIDEPDDKHSLSILARVFVKLAGKAGREGDFVAEIMWRTKVIEINGSPSKQFKLRAVAYYHLALSKQDRNDLEDAIAHVRKALMDDPAHRLANQLFIDLMTEHGWQLLENGAVNHAFERFSEVIERDALHHRSLAGRAKCRMIQALNLMKSDHVTVALARLRLAHEDILKAPTHPALRGRIHFELGKILFNTSQFEESLGHLSLAEDFLDENEGTYLTQNRQLSSRAKLKMAPTLAEQSGDMKEGFSLIKQVLSNSPSLLLESHLARAEIYKSFFELQKALVFYKKAFVAGSKVFLDAGVKAASCAAIMGLKDEAIHILYEFYKNPENVNRARELVKRNESDFFYLYTDARFQAWLKGEFRVHMKLNSAEIYQEWCAKMEPLPPFGNLCDVYVEFYNGTKKKWMTDKFTKDKYKIIWEKETIFDLEIQAENQIIFKDKDPVGEDEFIGVTHIPDWLVLKEGVCQLEIVNREKEVIGYVSFEIKRTNEDYGMSKQRPNPSVFVMYWPLQSCLIEFGISMTGLKPVIKTSLSELAKQFSDSSDSLVAAIMSYAGNHLTKFMPPGVKYIPNLYQLKNCLKLKIQKHNNPD